MDFISGIGGGINIGVTFTGLFKLAFLVIAIGYVLYNLLLTLRGRILSKTITTTSNGFISTMIYLHLIASILGAIFAVMLILIG